MAKKALFYTYFFFFSSFCFRYFIFGYEDSRIYVLLAKWNVCVRICGWAEHVYYDVCTKRLPNTIRLIPVPRIYETRKCYPTIYVHIRFSDEMWLGFLSLSGSQISQFARELRLTFILFGCEVSVFAFGGSRRNIKKYRILVYRRQFGCVPVRGCCYLCLSNIKSCWFRKGITKIDVKISFVSNEREIHIAMGNAHKRYFLWRNEHTPGDGRIPC